MWALTGGLGMGLGVGSSPPPGRIPATALAGASSDRALDSSGIDPTAGRKRDVRRELDGRPKPKKKAC